MVYPIKFIAMFKIKSVLASACKTQEPAVSSKDMRISGFYQPSTIDDFLFQKHTVVGDSAPSFRCTSDIYMLFNAQRLDRMSRDRILQHFNDMSVSNSSLAALKSKLTDDELILIVKSRYIQSPSELLSWSMYLNSLAVEQLQSYLSTLSKQETKDKQETTDEKLAPNPAEPAGSAAAATASV